MYSYSHTRVKQIDDVTKEIISFIVKMCLSFILFVFLVIYLSDKDQPYWLFTIAFFLFLFTVTAIAYFKNKRAMAELTDKHSMIKNEIEYALLDIRNNNNLSAITTLEGILGYPVFSRTALFSDDFDVI